MSEQYFLINSEEGTCSVRYDGLTPGEMLSLAEKLHANAVILLQKEYDPIRVMAKTLRRDSFKNEVTFQLSYSAPVLTVDLGWPTCPTPNVELTDAQKERYVKLFNMVVK